METKTCPGCKKIKALTEFKPNRTRADSLQGWCRDCDSAYHKEYYRKNKDRWTTGKYREGRNKEKDRNRVFIWKMLSQSVCTDCGHDDPRVLEFDHVRGEKFKNISYLMGNAASVATLQTEIEKCDIVCANCHRIRTYKRQGSYRIAMGECA